VFLSEPVRAELERIFHFIPNIGVVESDVVYEVEIICGKLQKDNVTVELRDCYVKGDFLLGTISITDISPYIHKEELFSDENMTIGEQMNEKYTITWYHNGEQRELFFTKGGANLRNNFKQIEKGLHQIIEKSENDYYEIGVNGFEEKLSFRLKETKAISNLNSIGNTVTQYGTSITAKAEMTEKGAKIDYYAICSEEAKTIHRLLDIGKIEDNKLIISFNNEETTPEEITLTKKDGEWIMDELSETDEQKINGLYNDGTNIGSNINESDDNKLNDNLDTDKDNEENQNDNPLMNDQRDSDDTKNEADDNSILE